jgi:hypothetical protein
MNKKFMFIYFTHIFDFLFDCHIKPVTMTKILIRFIFPVEIFYSFLSDGI